MSDIKLFSLAGKVSELPSSSVSFEKELQTIIEKNMTTFFGVTFLKSEHIITGGRIDSLGIDENFCPVIFEYKRSTNDYVITQGLFYLDFLLKHKSDFKLIVSDTLGKETANKIDWSMPQVICIAGGFNKFDEHAVNLVQLNIKLVIYKKFKKDLILFEYINIPKSQTIKDEKTNSVYKEIKSGFSYNYNKAPIYLKNIYDSIRDYILSLDEDITENRLKYYAAFKKVKNIICVEILKSKVLLHLSIDPKTVKFENNFSKDMTNIGHFGTGDVQVTIKKIEDFEKAKPLIDRANNEG